MKSRCGLLLCLLLATILQQMRIHCLSCSSPFTELPYASGTYCAKCDTTCLTCSGSSINSCSSCPADFTLNTNSSTCIAPSSYQITTVASAYHSYGFEMQTSWWSGGDGAWSNCGIITVLHVSGTAVLTVIHNNLNFHYQKRLMVSLWWFGGTSEQINILQKTSTGGLQATRNSSFGSTAGLFPAASYNPYCANSKAQNVEIYYPTRSRNMKFQFFSNNTGASWGLRQYVFITYNCHSDCFQCLGPLATDCQTCNDANKKMYESVTGSCLCKYQNGYYAYPTGNSTYYCVNRCPNFLATGQYFGDNTTKTCVLTCPAVSGAPQWGLSFASDQHGICVETCNPTITLGGSTVALYYDKTNKKCVTACPASQPYSWSIDRACYASCPNDLGTQYYKLNTDKTCVSVCPNVTQGSTVKIPLFIDNTTNTCVEQCDHTIGYYGYLDPVSGVMSCIFNCPAGYFQDMSSGKPLCTKVCPSPNWFGDFNTLPPQCVQTCSFGTYGDQTSSDRYCVPKCNGSYFGLQTGNRQCLSKCPTDTWGQPDNLVCATAPYQCMNLTTNPYGSATAVYNTFIYSTAIFSFADSHTRLCISAGSLCSAGQFKYNVTYLCVADCPSGTYANNQTYWCVDRCYGIYFADNMTNSCVQVCSPGYYADKGTSTGNKCVKNCNQTGGYPFRDDNLRQCVAVCSPGAGYADPLAQSCVFNCTPPLYLNDSVPTELTCVGYCASPYFAYNNSDSGICVLTCPEEPPMFGDLVLGHRICVDVCQVNSYGDQTGGSFRWCVPNCPANTFAQNDTLRRCVTRCNTSTYGRAADWTCVNEQQCPVNYTGDPTTNMCVNWCPVSAGTFADNISKLCVQKCPIASNGTYYYADVHIRWCIPDCISYNSTFDEYGNNSTQTCETQCLDRNSFADAQTSRRFCIDVCTWTVTDKYYRNNQTGKCVVSTGCTGTFNYSSSATYTQLYFADNNTLYCVQKCPNISATPSWGYLPTLTCVALCYGDTWGDNSTGVPLCVSLCSEYPTPLWSYNGPGDKSVMLCMAVCPPPYFGEDYGRTCVTNCPVADGSHGQTFAYDGTRRCLLQCPDGTWADYLTGVCFHSPMNCTSPCWYDWSNCTDYRWADNYNNSCTYLCNGAPYDYFGDNTTQSCTGRCANLSYADNQTGTRICVARCPGTYTIEGVVNGLYDSYGDNYTQRCVRHCQEPDTYADWQLSLCLTRCMGDDATLWEPTFANIFNRKCVIALFCPTTPDLYYGQNVTRTCQPACILNSSFADNITRMCIPQCYQFTNATDAHITRFYGDMSTQRPVCVISCPSVPRLFGQNVTNLCETLCPDHQYGDQTGNRSCVPVCPNIGGVTWFSQLTQRICVLVCEEGTWGNYYNYIGPHCQTVGTDCNNTYYGDNSTHMCVPLCPESMNYFGQPSSRLCVDRCPYLNSSTMILVNATADGGINLVDGQLFADYKTRLCVYTCPADYGLQGTFGDNSTATCVQRCPDGSYGDANTVNRFCVSTCSGGAYADNLTNLCVDVCPASPPTFGYDGNWTCLKSCPGQLWAESSSRLCQVSCSPHFRLTLTENTCVSVCPSDPDLYGDTTDYNCTTSCSGGQYADPTDRMCKTSCAPLFQYNFRCVQVCPLGYYANAASNCVIPTACDANTYGDNSTTQCVLPCPAGSFADPISRYCIAVCPDGSWGDNRKCQTSCQTPGTTADNITQLCQAICTNYTYSYLGECHATCSGTLYANDNTHLCDSSCPLGLFGEPVSHRCVQYCLIGYYRQSTGTSAGFCVMENGGCNPLFADNVTGNCVTKCSTGFWGYTGNYTCLPWCPSGFYGYQSPTQRTCYAPLALPGTAPMLFADDNTGQFVSVCAQTPVLTYGDRNRQLCVAVCQPYLATAHYGDPASRECEPACTSPSHYTADPATALCTLRCTYGTFRSNSTPICIKNCPSGYGDYTSRICVSTCGQLTNTFGFYNTTSTYSICLALCPDTYYSQNVTRTCTQLCPFAPTKYYAYNGTRECVTYCNDSYADDSIRRCVSQCLSVSWPNADNSTNKCVATCPSVPDFYADNHVCVFYCTTAGYYADTNGRVCTARCSNISTGSGYVQYGDPRTGRCEINCSQGTWGDNSTNLCVNTCPLGSFADNTTGKCVAECPKNEGIYADMLLHVCASTCSGGYFGSQVNQTCIQVCDLGYYGDPTTTLCTDLCPVKIYSYGQNVTRTCVTDCKGWVGAGGVIGYADNYSRLCRDVCQNTIPVETFIDPIDQACVEICRWGWYAENTSNICTQSCPGGTFADNFSSYCVDFCPNDPQSYGDTTLNICIYSCLRGQFSDNTTNLCVGTCPSLLDPSAVDYYGDSHTGRCVFWCTEGTYAHTTSRLCVGTCPSGEFADNLTRRCVAGCPASEQTFADSTTHRCVRICPDGYYAQNTTQSCTPVCWAYSATVFGYADNVTKFCVAVCPFGFFGDNITFTCVEQCSSSRDQYGHDVGRVCVARLNCYGDTGTGQTYYADSTTRTCVQKCPLTLWADTHIYVCVLTCDVLIPQYRNRHTQLCVWPCPSDPDEYADDANGDCVRTCTTGTYAWIGNRTCQSSCAPFSLYADNTTNRCESSCASLPYLYADSLIWKCVLHCTGSYFADNRTQSCVSQCPSQWALFGELTNHTCVSLCPPNYFADVNNNRQCHLTCSSSWFADSYTSSCVQHCNEVRPYWFEDTSTGSGVCVAVCPGQSYGYLADQTCKYTVGGISACPGSYYADRTSRLCVTQCPNGTYSFSSTKYCQSTCSGIYYADPVLRQCVTTCSGNLFKYQKDINTNLCVQYCPATHYALNATTGVDSACVLNCTPLLALPTTRTCQHYCPLPYFGDWANNLCVQNCTPKLAYTPNRTCLATCEPPFYGNPLTLTCDLLCPLNYYGQNSSRLCLTACPNTSYADPSIRICVADCPSHPSLYADDRTNQCLSSCASPLFADDVTRTCASSCNNVTVGSAVFRYMADPYISKCVLECNNQLISFANYLSNECTKQCPNGYYANNYTKECVLSCPNIPNDTYSDNTSKICMDQCLPGSYGYQATLNCVANCWWPYFADPTTRTCVQYCPLGYFGNNASATCSPTCPTNSYADPVTHRCLAHCPALHQYFDYDANWTCLKTCPAGFYANTDLQACVSICNSSTGMYSYPVTNQCVRQCPIPYRGYAPNNTCLLACPATEWFYDVTINVCSPCDSKCYICISATNCRQCFPGYNQFNGYCNTSCIPTTVITYANAAGQCVQVCPSGTFGNNVSYACVTSSNCPTQQYGQPTTRLCTYCPSTCASCLNMSYCTACQPGATPAIDNMCYTNCNSTANFSYNGQCWTNCPNGTYLTYTGVTCAACAQICLTCSTTATSCLTCSASYHHGSTCLSVCPSGFYGDAATLSCLNCTSSPSTACDKPLNFTTSYSVQNYQGVITLQFNQNVSILKNLQDILNINLVVNRLLETERVMQTIGTLVNNGVTYTYQILANGTIKLYLDVGLTLSNPTFSVSITDPAAVVSSETGMALQNVQSLINIAKIDYYPPSDSSEAGTNFPATFTSVVFLLLFMFTFFFSDVLIRPLQMLQLLFLHSMIDSPVAANLFYLLARLRMSTLYFVTNWFGASFPLSPAYYDTPLLIQDVCTDYIFLRNVGQVFVVMVIYASFWFVFLMLGNKRLVSHKVWHGFFSEVSEKRFQWMVVNDAMGLFYVPVTYFGFWQFRHLFGSGIYGFNGFATLLFVLLAIGTPILWMGMWCKRTPQVVHNTLWFLTLRVKSDEGEAIVIHDEKSEEMIKEKSDEKSQPAATVETGDSNPYQTETMVFYAYFLLCSIWMVGLYSAPLAQLVLLIITNALLLVYLIKVRPYLNKINLIFTILFVLTLLTLQSFQIYFYKHDAQLYASDKTRIAFPLVVTLCVVLILMVVWALWRVVWQVSFLVQNFKETLLYKQFADYEVEAQKEESEKYSEYDKLAKISEVGVGDIVVDKIQQQYDEEGSKVIKVTKKRLVKKAKAKRNRKGQLIPQEQSSPFDYVRVNQINVFDYANQLDEPQEKAVEEPVEPIKHRKDIDDDARDIVSDLSQEHPYGGYRADEEEKKIDLEPGETIVKDADQLSNIEEVVPSSQSASEYPFADLEAGSQKQSEQEKRNQERESHVEDSYQLDQLEAAKEHEDQEGYEQMAPSELQSHNKSEQKISPEISQEVSSPRQKKEQARQEKKEKQPEVRGLQELLEEEEGRKKKNLLFLFDDFEEEQK